MHTTEATKVFSQGTRAGASTSTLTAATPGIDRRKCVYFIRHGRSKCNLLREMKDPRADTREVQDTELAPLGCEQASALARLTKKWELDCIMSSPLRRTLHTSALAFEGRSLPLYVYSVLRETYWEDYESRGLSKTSPREYLRSISSSLHADEVCLHFLESKEDKYWDPATEDGQADPTLHSMSQEAVKLVWSTVCSRPEENIAVVTHWGVLRHLFGVDASNCAVYKIHAKIGSDGTTTVEESYLLDETTGGWVQRDIIAPSLVAPILGFDLTEQD